MATERYDVRGRTILITGAARGIGADAARRLAERGANLALAGLEPERLQALAEELGTDRAAPFECDVRDRAALDRAVAGAVERFGGIDVVIANAGIATVGTIETLPEEDFERVLEVNLFGVWRTVRAALPHVIERRGYVLPISSLAAAVHAPLMANYAMAKAGVEAFGDALRVEVAHKGVDVGVAYFGFMDTDMVRNSFSDPAATRARKGQPGLVFKPLPVDHAGRAIVRGIERRARRVYAPRWILPALLASGLVQQLADQGARRQAPAAVDIANERARTEG